MNERIKQIAEQASHQSPDGYPVTIPYSKDFAKKFAELIIKECANIVYSHTTPWDAFVNAPAVVNDMKNHFGVEE